MDIYNPSTIDVSNGKAGGAIAPVIE